MQGTDYYWSYLYLATGQKNVVKSLEATGILIGFANSGDAASIALLKSCGLY